MSLHLNRVFNTKKHVKQLANQLECRSILKNWAI